MRSGSKRLDVGDLAVTRDMGIASGQVVFIVGKNHYSDTRWTCYDIIMRGQVFDGVDEDFLQPVEGDS